MTPLEKIQSIVNSVDTKGKVALSIDDSGGPYGEDHVYLKICLIDNSRCCDMGFVKSRFSEMINIKEAIESRIKMVIEETRTFRDIMDQKKTIE